MNFILHSCECIYILFFDLSKVRKMRGGKRQSEAEKGEMESLRQPEGGGISLSLCVNGESEGGESARREKQSLVARQQCR